LRIRTFHLWNYSVLQLSAKHLLCAHCIGNVQGGRLILFTSQLFQLFDNKVQRLKVAEVG